MNEHQLVIGQSGRGMSREDINSQIKSIWDNKGKTLDRYTIVLESYFDREETQNDCLCLSLYPTSPLGFSQFSGCDDGEHLGGKLTFEELPEHIQRHIVDRLSMEV